MLRVYEFDIDVTVTVRSPAQDVQNFIYPKMLYTSKWRAAGAKKNEPQANVQWIFIDFSTEKPTNIRGTLMNTPQNPR